MADSPSFVDARAELTPETAGDNGAPTAATTVPNERTGSRRQLFTDIHEFREQLSDQGLKYDPKFKEYPGDERMRANTKLSAHKRAAVTGSNNVKRKKRINK